MLTSVYALHLEHLDEGSNNSLQALLHSIDLGNETPLQKYLGETARHARH